MDANSKGRECVDALFPDAHIAWREPSEGLPADWRGFEINVPGVVDALPETKLPLEITGGMNLHEVDPDALAYLLAVGVVRQGGCAGVYSDECLNIFSPENHAWH
jgi:hypothetical protein